MLEAISGVVRSRELDSVVVESGPVSLRLKIPVRIQQELVVGESATFFSHLLLRDDQFHLYGFITNKDRDTFRVLISVSGLGPEKALALLGVLTPSAVVSAVQTEDAGRFQIVKGIGTRLAQRIVIDLKGKIEHLADDTPAFDQNTGTARQTDDLVATLARLGYPRAVAESAARVAMTDAGEDTDIEMLVKAALRSLQNQA